MIHLLIDGYNVLYASSFKDRDPFIAALVEYRRVKPCDLSVIFDGTHSGTGSGDRKMYGGIEVVFTPLTVQADDHIEGRLLRSQANRTVVVSSDRRLHQSALRIGAAYVTAQEFLLKLSGRMEGRVEKKDPARTLGKDERRRREMLKKL